MPKPKTCKAEFHAAEQTFVCVLPEDHDGPVHRSDDGHEWGDPALFIPPVEPPA